MNADLYLSRLTLKRGALAPILDPDNDGRRIDLGHRLLWAAFSDGPDRRRDYLWRVEERGRYFALSRRPPCGGSDFLHIETKAFAPRLRAGEPLRFSLRANATRCSQRVRRPLRNEDCPAWLDRQGERAGFAVERLDECRTGTMRFPRRCGDTATLMATDFSGVVRVVDPGRFVEALAEGIGRGRGYGLGLMMIRRAA